MSDIMHKFMGNDTVMRAQKSFTVGWLRAFMEIKGIDRAEIEEEIRMSEISFLKSCTPVEGKLDT